MLIYVDLIDPLWLILTFVSTRDLDDPTRRPFCTMLRKLEFLHRWQGPDHSDLSDHARNGQKNDADLSNLSIQHMVNSG